MLEPYGYFVGNPPRGGAAKEQMGNLDVQAPSGAAAGGGRHGVRSPAATGGGTALKLQASPSGLRKNDEFYAQK
jgi:hypothetical protein